MSVMDILKKGADYTNADETAKGMMQILMTIKWVCSSMQMR